MDKKILEKLETMDGRLDRIDITIAEQALDLKHHIERTDKLQEIVEPIYRRDQQLIGMFKFLTGVGVIVGIIKAFKTFF